MKKKSKVFYFISGILASLILLQLVSVSLAQNSTTQTSPGQNLWNFLQNLLFTNHLNQNLIPQSSQPVSLYKPVADYEDSVINAVASAQPSVVSITITKNLPVIEQYYVNPFEQFQQLFPDQNFPGFQFQVPQYRQKGYQKQEVGGGSGFIVSADGLIVTNKHVVADSEADYTVLLNDGRKFDAKVLARHPSDDIAILKIGATGLTPLPLGDSDTIRLGQTAIAIGNALGEFRNTVSVGVISGLARTIQATDDQGNIETLNNVIQTDAAINPGNSGGPLLNLRGEVVGVNTALVSGAQSIGFAIPINRVKQAINSVSRTGKIIVPYLGVRYILVDKNIQTQEGLPYDYGALVSKGSNGEAAVISGSPAQKAGLQEGDLILEYNSQKITQDKTLSYLIGQGLVGQTVGLKIWRNGQVFNLNVTLTQRPQNQ